MLHSLAHPLHALIRVTYLNPSGMSCTYINTCIRSCPSLASTLSSPPQGARQGGRGLRHGLLGEWGQDLRRHGVAGDHR